MMTWSFRAGAAALCIGALTSGCTGLTSPSPTPSVTGVTTQVPVPPPASRFTLKGRVTETAPTVGSGIGGALVHISGGTDAGRSATADEYGNYMISEVETGATINVSADGYVSMLR